MGEGWARRKACTYSYLSLFMLPPAQSLTVSKKGKLILCERENQSLLSDWMWKQRKSQAR